MREVGNKFILISFGLEYGIDCFILIDSLLINIVMIVKSKILVFFLKYI